MKKLESTFVNMVVVLTLITLIVAGGLGAMYMVTEKPIADAKKAKQETAIREVLPEFDYVDTAIVMNEQNVYRAFTADNKIVGLAIETWTSGFGGTIKVMVGIDAKGNIVNYSLLEHKETPGLGSKLDTWFKEKSDIRGTSIANRPLMVSKDKGEFDAITAATISSRAFLDAINKAAETYIKCLDWAHSEHPDAFSAATTIAERRIRKLSAPSDATSAATAKATTDTISANKELQTDTATANEPENSINTENNVLQ